MFRTQKNTKVFDAPIEFARDHGFDIVMATDPDCDRLGCAAPVSNGSGDWRTLTGNQIGGLLTDYVLSQHEAMEGLTGKKYIVSTLVTSLISARIAQHYGVRCENNNLVGFKYIAGVMDREGADDFLFGYEESHGYLIGQYARDKDGAAACMLLAELVASLKSEGRTIHEKLADLYRLHGCHRENLVNVQMEGSEGMALMTKLMEKFRSQPPVSIGGMEVVQVRDYASLTCRSAGNETTPLDGPQGNMVILDLAEEGNYIAVRPSGTEPKVKFYMFSYLPSEQSQDPASGMDQLEKRLADMECDVREFAASIN